MSNNKNTSSSDCSLDSMAKRYKDEMMRIYRMNGNASQNAQPQAQAAAPTREAETAPSAAAQTESDPTSTGTGNCSPVRREQNRFLTAEELINGAEPVSGSDITGELLNGTGSAPASLASGGTVNMDTNSRNSSGQSIYVPQNSAPAAYSMNDGSAANDSENSFRGVMVNPAVIGTANNSSAGSEILSELLPSFEFPPDIEVGEPVPAHISPSFVILSPWFNLTGDNGWGYLQFEVTTGSLGNPVQNATVVISRVVNNRRLLTRIIKTDYAGVTKTICLPAPRYYPIASPYAQNGIRPFAEYRASVYAQNYYPVTDIAIMLEAGVKSVQPVDMVPLPERPTRPGIMPRSGS